MGSAKWSELMVFWSLLLWGALITRSERLDRYEQRKMA